MSAILRRSFRVGSQRLAPLLSSLAALLWLAGCPESQPTSLDTSVRDISTQDAKRDGKKLDATRADASKDASSPDAATPKTGGNLREPCRDSRRKVVAAQRDPDPDPGIRYGPCQRRREAITDRGEVPGFARPSRNHPESEQQRDAHLLAGENEGESGHDPDAREFPGDVLCLQQWTDSYSL